MDTARIAGLLEPFLAAPPSPTQLAQISTYIDLLQRWNARVNLTAVRDPDAIVTRHFGESLFAARHLLSPEPPTPLPARSLAEAGDRGSKAPRSLPEHSGRVLDVGSGAGFPGLPLKIFAPAIRLTLLESNQKKVAFLREVIRAITFTGVDVSPVRAEHAPPASAALVTLRAVERFETILPAAARLVAPWGRLALLIATPQIPRALRLTPHFAWSDPYPTPLSQNRVVLIGARRA